MQVVLTLSGDQGAVADEARAAEDAGYDGVATGEHLFFHGPVTNGFVTLAAAAGATTRIRLLSSLTVLPLYPAALAAKLAATLDQVSNGRFDMGVGVGGEHPPEFVAAGVDVTERGARADEAPRADDGSSGAAGRVDFDGRFTRVPGPGPRPAPGAAGRAADLAGRPPAGGDPPRGPLRRRLDALHVHARAGGREPGRGARRRRRRPAGTRRSSAAPSSAGAASTPTPEVARREVVEGVSAVYQQDFTRLADRYLLHGDPDRVAARAREYADAGAETLIFSPVGEGTRRREVVDLFTRSVLPQIRPLA